jgi:hypothetical protein
MTYTVHQQILTTVQIELPDDLSEREIGPRAQKAALAKIGAALAGDPAIEWQPYDVTVEWDELATPAGGGER